MCLCVYICICICVCVVCVCVCIIYIWYISIIVRTWINNQFLMQLLHKEKQCLICAVVLKQLPVLHWNLVTITWKKIIKEWCEDFIYGKQFQRGIRLRFDWGNQIMCWIIYHSSAICSPFCDFGCCVFRCPLTLVSIKNAKTTFLFVWFQHISLHTLFHNSFWLWSVCLPACLVVLDQTHIPTCPQTIPLCPALEMAGLWVVCRVVHGNRHLVKLHPGIW